MKNYFLLILFVVSIMFAEIPVPTVKDSVKAETIEKFISTLNNCEFARFAPGDAASMMETIYNEALYIISKIERELK